MCLFCLAWAGTRQALPAALHPCPSGEGRSQYECTALGWGMGARAGTPSWVRCRMA